GHLPPFDRRESHRAFRGPRIADEQIVHGRGELVIAHLGRGRRRPLDTQGRRPSARARGTPEETPTGCRDGKHDHAATREKGVVARKRHCSPVYTTNTGCQRSAVSGQQESRREIRATSSLTADS